MRVVELRKSNFEYPQWQFRNFFQSAIPQSIFGSPQYCGIAEVRTKTADALLCLLTVAVEGTIAAGRSSALGSLCTLYNDVLVMS
jgi:hypothetical protein